MAKKKTGGVATLEPAADPVGDMIAKAESREAAAKADREANLDKLRSAYVGCLVRGIHGEAAREDDLDILQLAAEELSLTSERMREDQQTLRNYFALRQNQESAKAKREGVDVEHLRREVERLHTEYQEARAAVQAYHSAASQIASCKFEIEMLGRRTDLFVTAGEAVRPRG